MKRLWMLSLGMVIVVAAGGCARTQSRADDGQKEIPASDQQVAVSELERRAGQLSDLAHKLPGRSADESYSLMADSFNLLQQILGDLRPTEADGAFVQRMAIIENAEQRLRAQGSAGPSLEPTVTHGLQAARDALADIQQTRFRENTEIASATQSAGRRIDQLDTVRAAMHRFVAAQAVRDMTRAIEMMVNIIHPPAAETTGE